MQEAIDKVKGSLAALRAEALSKYEQSNQRPPAILYQYTDATGLMGSLQSGAVWATDARLLNDAAELEYFRQAVQEIASEAKPALRTAHAVRFADELLENSNDQFFMGSIYVASLVRIPMYSVSGALTRRTGWVMRLAFLPLHSLFRRSMPSGTSPRVFARSSTNMRIRVRHSDRW